MAMAACAAASTDLESRTTSSIILVAPFPLPPVLPGPPPPPPVPTPPLLFTRLVCATRSKNRRSSSLNSPLDCWICSGVNRLISAVRLRNTCLPIQLLPTNFLEMRIGSQLRSLDRKVRRVVPSVNGRRPDLNSWMSRLAYASSSGVHLPRRRGGPFFLELLEDVVAVEVGVALVEAVAGWRGGRGLEAGAATGGLAGCPAGLAGRLAARAARAAAVATAAAPPPPPVPPFPDAASRARSSAACPALAANPLVAVGLRNPSAAAATAAASARPRGIAVLLS